MTDRPINTVATGGWVPTIPTTLEQLAAQVAHAAVDYVTADQEELDTGGPWGALEHATNAYLAGVVAVTDHDTGGTLDGWDDELDDWTEDDRVTDQQATERLHDLAFAGDKCIRHKPPTLDACRQGYDHTGPCDWFAEATRRNYTIADVGAHLGHDRAQQAYNAVTNPPPPMIVDWEAERRAGLMADRGYCDEAP